MENQTNIVKDFIKSVTENPNFLLGVYKENKIAFVTMSGIIYISKVPTLLDEKNKVLSMEYPKEQERDFHPGGIFPFFIISGIKEIPTWLLVTYPEIIMEMESKILLPFKVLDYGEIKKC